VTAVNDVVQPGLASDRVADSLPDGEIKPGEWIRQEEVAERLGASRLPVRDALRILTAEGLTEHEPNRGARVPLLDKHEVSVIYQLRERIEPLALMESLANLTADDLDEIAALQSRIEVDVDVDTFLELDREFHLRTYAGCQVGQINSMVTRLWNSTQYYRRLFMTASGPSRMLIVNAEHRLLIDAISRRDAVDAERYLAGHIRRTRIELQKLPDLALGCSASVDRAESD
jgi:DNA-binding GntR family transcriptional regulator